MTWNIEYDKVHAFKIFSDSNAFDSSDNSVRSSSPSDESLDINDFYGSELFNTEIIADNLSGDDIKLSLDDKIINLCIDESGSMLWNDKLDLRYDVVDRLANRIESTYAGNVYYNVFTFNGKKAKINTMAANINEDPFNDLLDRPDCDVDLDNYRDGINRFAGIRLVRNSSRFPQSPLDGDIVFEGICTKVIDSEISLSEEYFYKIFTFDENLKFSPGKKFSLTSNNSNVPAGFDGLSLQFIKGVGAVVDSSTLASWQFSIANEDYVYDFTGNNDLTVSSDMVWLPSSEVQLGNSAIRMIDDPFSFTDNNDNLLIESKGKLSIMAWIFPYTTTGFQGIVNRGTLGNVNYELALNGDALSFVYGNNIVETSTSGVILANEWNFVAITVDFSLSSNQVLYYVNGSMVGSDSLSPSSTSSLSGAAVRIGSSTQGSLNFSGAISYISIHSDIKDSTYVLNRYLDGSAEDQDNGDRLILGKGYIEDNSFIGDQLKIVYDRHEDPTLPEEFTAVHEISSMTEGDFYFTHKTNFAFQETYRYRVFTNNSYNYSHLDDSQLFEMQPPTLSQVAQERKALESKSFQSPSSVVVLDGNRKAYIKWSTSDLDDNVNQVRIYYSKEEFPVVDSNSAIPIDESFTGELIFAGDPSLGSYLHENIENDIFHYYTIVFSDGVSYLSNTNNIVAIPQITADETMIPLKDVKRISYEQVSENSSVNVFWDLPYDQKIVSGYFDEEFVFFAKVTDEFNNILDVNDFAVSAEITSSFKKIDNEGEDVFKGVFELNAPEEDSLYQFVSSKFKDGIFKGRLLFPSSELLLNYKSCELDIVLKIAIPDVTSEKDVNSNYTENIFVYNSEPFKVVAQNPMDVKLSNLGSKKVKINKNNVISVLSNKTLQEKVEFNGFYVGTSDNFVIRALLSNKNALLASPSTLKVSVYETKTDLFSGENLEPEDNEFSEDILFETPSVTTENIDVVDENGNITGEKTRATYSDVSISTPSYPVNLLVYIEITLDNFRYVLKYPIVVANTLQVDLKTGIPSADGLATEEQFATIYKINPDDPTNLSARTLVPDNTPVIWTLTKGDNATIDRPFISSSPTSPNFEVPDDSVVSFTNNGVARDIFFGPLTEVEVKGYDEDLNPIFEQYNINVNVFYDGLSTSTSQTVELVPLIFETEGLAGSFFLMEFSDKQEKFYTDGIDYAKLVISHDPNSAVTRYSSCFVECLNNLGKNIYTLLPGTGVQIATDDPDIEIIHGDVREITDPYTGRSRLETNNANISLGSAIVSLENGDETYVYLRKNDIVVDQKIESLQTFQNSCSCLGIDREAVFNKEIKVFGSLTSIFNSSIETLTGGGSMSEGVPPTILVPEEPLKVSLAGIKVDDELVEGLQIDGSTVNELVFDVSFSDFPVPDGVTVNAQVVNLIEDVLAVGSDSVTTTQKVDSDISDSVKSYASINLREIPRGKAFESYLIVSASYDELGTQSRTATSCFLISYNSDENSSDITSNLFSKKLYSVSTSPVGSSWSELSDMPIARSSHGLVSDGSGNLYALGGINSNSVLSACHKYDIGTDSWISIASMPTARFGFQSIYLSGKIYVFGGYFYNEELLKVEVSQAAEVYDVSSGTWEILTSMPSIDLGFVDNLEYGVASGVVEHVSGVIYILSGVRKISEDGSFTFYNDRILSYTISTDTWSWTDDIGPEEVSSYRRISPVSFVNGTEIVVFSGSSQSNDGEMSLLTTAYKFDTSGTTISDANSDFIDTLEPSYNAANAYVSSDTCYVIGGTTYKSRTSRKSDSLDISASPYDNAGDNLPDLPQALSDSRISIDSNTLYLSGGNRSGNDKDMVIIDAEIENPRMFLNSRDHVSVNVELKNDDGELITDTVTVVARGYVQNKNKEGIEEFLIANENVKYEVVFSEDKKIVSNGKASFVLSPRSDDVLEELFETIDLDEGKFSDRYKIIVEILVDSDTRFGKTILNTNNESIANSQEREDCVSIYNNLKISQLNINNTTSENSFSLVPLLQRQGQSGVVNVVTDDIWVNNVTKLNDKFLNSSEVSEKLADLAVQTPFGNSPLYNALYQIALDLSSESNDEIEKIIYAFTDKEESFSSVTLDDSIAEVNAIDGPKEVPCVICNFSDVEYPSVYSLQGQTSSASLNKIAFETNGQAVTVRNENIDELIKIISGKAKGSLGYGRAKYVHEFSEPVIIKSIRVNYDLYDNTGGYWFVSRSDDGQKFIDRSKRLAPNELVDLVDFQTRYLEFDMHMFSGLSVSNGEEYESIPTPSGPVITSIEINYTPCKEDYIFVNSSNTGLDPSQIVVALNSNMSSNDNIEIEIGASTSNSSNWFDFSTDPEPAISSGGRIFLLRRQGTVQNITLEPMDYVDGYIFKTRYGSWHKSANINIYDASDTSIKLPSSLYKTIPSKGLVVFKQKQLGDLYVNIDNDSQFNLAVKVNNKNSTKDYKLYSLGYLYTLRDHYSLVRAQDYVFVASNLETQILFSADLGQKALFDINDDIIKVTKIATGMVWDDFGQNETVFDVAGQIGAFTAYSPGIDRTVSYTVSLDQVDPLRFTITGLGFV